MRCSGVRSVVWIPPAAIYLRYKMWKTFGIYFCVNSVAQAPLDESNKLRPSLCTRAHLPSMDYKDHNLTEEENLWMQDTYRYVPSMHLPEDRMWLPAGGKVTYMIRRRRRTRGADPSKSLGFSHPHFKKLRVFRPSLQKVVGGMSRRCILSLHTSSRFFFPKEKLPIRHYGFK